MREASLHGSLRESAIALPRNVHPLRRQSSRSRRIVMRLPIPASRNYERLSVVQAFGIVAACAIVIGIGISLLPI